MDLPLDLRDRVWVQLDAYSGLSGQVIDFAPPPQYKTLGSSDELAVLVATGSGVFWFAAPRLTLDEDLE